MPVRLSRKGDGRTFLQLESGHVIHMDPPEMGHKPAPWDAEGRAADHYRCTIRFVGRQMTLDFWCGVLYGEPRVADVLDCLLSDASGVENNPYFEDWRKEYGYDTDSRKAWSMYKACTRQTERLRKLLGSEYEVILYGWDGEWKEV